MPDPRPNILFIMSDDHASHAMSCYGSRINRTPHLDRIADGGVRLDSAFCTNSICAPSRAAILTGTVGVAEHLGSDSFVHVDVPGMEPVNVRIAGGADISEDQEAGLDFDLADAHIFDEDGRRLDIC